MSESHTEETHNDNPTVTVATKGGNFSVIGQESWKLKFSQQKQGGANSAGKDGGEYTFTSEGREQKMLLKQDKPEKDMAEFLASKIFEATSPENSARVVLAIEQNSKEAYIGSIFFDDYKDLSKEVVASSAPKKNGRTFAAGTINAITGFMRVKMLGKDGNPKYENFAQSMATSLLLGDFDVHTGNVGIVGENKLVRIDFAAAFDNLEDEIHPHSRSKHPFGFGPTNHYVEYPRKLRITKEMSDECLKIASMTKEIEEKIDQAFTEMVQVYSYDDFKKFEERTFGKQSVGELSKSTEETKLADLVEKIKTKTKEKIQKRQESLREYGVEVGISVAFDGRGNLDKKKKDDLEKLVKENPEYFEKLLSGEKKLHLRGQSIIYRFMDKIGLSHTQKNILAEITIIKDNLDNPRPEISPRIPAAARQPSREGQTLTQEDPPILSTTTNGSTLSEPKPEIIPTKEEITKAAPSESVVARSISVKERAKQFEKAKDNKPVSEEKQKIETGVKVSQLRAAFEQRQTYTTTAHTKKSTSTGPTR